MTKEVKRKKTAAPVRLYVKSIFVGFRRFEYDIIDLKLIKMKIKLY